jgi:trehalose-phosphatase
MSEVAGHSRLGFDAVIFDMDGVVTDTARLHAVAWKRLFDDYLRVLAEHSHIDFVPFDERRDYLSYVDGKPRYDGVRSFLQARGLELPEGDPADAPGSETVCSLGNAKDELFERMLHEQGPEVFASTLALIKQLRARGIRIAVVTSSRHGREVLALAGIENFFDAGVDGVAAASLGLKGKPEPDIFLKAAQLLGVDVRRSVVVEDAIAGVQAGRNGAFGLVIGVDRGGNREALATHGADIVVADLGELGVEQIDSSVKAALPSALAQRGAIEQRLDRRQVAVFLDYDGTLTPIVERPELAVLSEDMRAAVRALGRCCTTAIVSGRGLADVTRLVGLKELYYAGNHGFEITGPGHTEISYEPGKQFLAAVDEVSRRIEDGIKHIDGVLVENKLYSASVHYRLVATERVAEVERIVDKELAHFSNLHKRPGKKVFEIRPKMDWDKGKAVLWLLQGLCLDGPEVVPIYIGDDVTDEDAFAALKGRGIGVLVTDVPRPSAADYSLRNTDEVQQLLRALTALLCARKS